MRRRLLAFTAALALTVGVFMAIASPASAHCGGHSVHPDLHNRDSDVSWGSGTNIRTQPHTDCSVRGQGFPGQGIDVHCAINDGTYTSDVHRHWLYVRNTSTGVSGWARQDALNHPEVFNIKDCTEANWYHTIY